jgi:hypothetical protein
MDIQQVAATNPGVDAKKVEQAIAIRMAMEKAGVFRRADYRLSPPLGTGPGAVRPAATGVTIVRMRRAR